MAVVTTGSTQSVDFSLQLGSFHVPTTVVLRIYDSDLVRAPTSIQVTVDGADAGATLTFQIDGEDVWTATADPDGSLGLTSVPVPPDLPVAGNLDAGTHTLSVSAPSNGEASADFDLELATSIYPVLQSADADPVVAPDSAGRWVFQDLMPGGLGSWVLPIGPSAMTPPHVEKQVSVTHTTAPDTGIYQINVPGTKTKPWELNGYCPDEEFYDNLVAYAGINRRFYIIDHRGRAWTVAVESLKVKPRKRQRDDAGNDLDWPADWTLSAVIMDQTWVEPVEEG